MDDASDLRERVRALEQTVSDQQATITELRERGVSRRGVLAGGAGLGAIGLGVLGSQSASAQAAGQVGTESEPVDVEAATLNASNVSAGSVNTDNQTIENELFAESLTLSNDPSNPSRGVTRADDNIGDAGRDSVAKKVLGDNSDTDLFTDTNASISAGLFVVSGRVTGDSARFTDAVMFAFSGGVTVIGSAERDTVGPRSYDASGGLSVSIDDSGSEYNIVAQSLSMFLEG